MKWLTTTQNLRKLVILLILEWILITSCQSASDKFNSGSDTSAMQDYVCSANDVIEDAHAITNEMQCASLCAMNRDCYGFFYHSGEQACVSCRDLYYSTSGLSSHQGMSYYRKEGDFGIWSAWTAWTACPVTCGGGTISRSRTCTQTPCSGLPTDEISCHSFSCKPLASTCAKWKGRGLSVSTDADIDPDGPGSAFGQVRVPCDLDSEPDKAITVMHHDKEDRTPVDGYEDCGSYQAVLGYTVGFEAAKAIADRSTGCSQFVQWESMNAQMDGGRCTFWKNRNMAGTSYFTRPHSSGLYCECGQTNTCVVPNFDCNAGADNGVLQSDGGNVTVKADLPMYSFNAGDTDHDKEDRTLVDGYEAYGSYQAVLGYTVGFEAAKAIADRSTGCSQFVQWESMNAQMAGGLCTFWKNRNMAGTSYFTRPHSSGLYCECGQTNTCVVPNFDCNAGADNGVLQSDGGNVTVKADLPIYSFNAGDTDHDKEDRTLVDGYEAYGSYQAVLGYTVGFEAAKAIADRSTGCSQFVQWESMNAQMAGGLCTFWKNRNMAGTSYFTRPHSSGLYCECGQTNTCVVPNFDCNAGADNGVLQSDGGNVTVKADLPIYSFNAGDTGGNDEYGYHTVGPLLCY